jgi:hypothetical protein
VPWGIYTRITQEYDAFVTWSSRRRVKAQDSSSVPSVVAIVLTAIVFGKGALRRVLGRLLIWRVNPLWYLVVILGPVALAGSTVGLNALLGGHLL